MKTSVLACVFLSLTLLEGAGAAKPVYLVATGSGAGTDHDRSTAHDQADSQAQSNMNSTCPGTVTESQKTYDQCSQLDDNWVCNVSYRGTCQVGQ